MLDWLSYVHPFGAFGLHALEPLHRSWLCHGSAAGATHSARFLRGRPDFEFDDSRHAGAGMDCRQRIPLVGTGYGLALTMLLRPSVRFDPSLFSVRDLFLLLAAVVVSSAAVACTYVSLLVTTGLLHSQDVMTALLRYWVGDMIGVAVVTPFGLLALTRRRLIKLEWESLFRSAAPLL